MTPYTVELAAWIKILARPTIKLGIGYDADEPVITVTDMERGRTGQYLLAPVST